MKKIVSVIALSLATVALFAGGAKETTNTNTTAKTTLKIVTWSNQSSVDAIKNLAEEYMAKYPDVQVEVTDVDTNQYNNLLSTRLQANDVDVISLNGDSFLHAKVDWAPADAPYWQKLADSNVIMDLTDQPWVANWSQSAIDAATYNNKVWAITTGANATTGVFYNKAMFEENGWNVPKTWNEFENLAKDMKAKGINPMTTGGADVWPYQMLVNDIIAGVDDDYDAFVKGLWQGNRTYTDATSRIVYERIDWLNNNMEPGFMGIGYGAVVGRFVNGKAAMLPDGAWQSSEIVKADPEFEFGYFPMPGTKAGVNFQGKFDLYFAINSKTENKEAALNWMAMLSEKNIYEEFVNITGFIPTQENITIKNEFVSGLLPYTSGLKNSWELYYRAPVGVGQYADNKGFNGQYLKSAGGPIDSISELAELTQKDFSDGVKAVTK